MKAHASFPQLVTTTDTAVLLPSARYASGCAVVSTDVGGVPAILADGIQGLLARRDDHEAIAAAVIRLLRDPALAEQLTKQARQACDAYQWSHVRARWLTVYRQLASPDAVPAPNPA